MSGVSVLTLVRNREGHLRQLIEGLRHSARAPDELIIVDMSDEPVRVSPTPFPVRLERLDGNGLPLAAARNRAAALAAHDQLVFLDVDCIPMTQCLGLLCDAMTARDGLFCADIRYLGPDHARQDWSEDELLAAGRPHPVRGFPRSGVRQEANPGLFWSLAFALRRSRFAQLGGFDDGFVGYGAEDTDLGFRAAAAGIPLFFVGGAIACHQHHASHEPPVQHLADIIRNARRFHARWRRWPMEGWLEAFRAMGLITWDAHRILIVRPPTDKEIAATEVNWVGSM